MGLIVHPDAVCRVCGCSALDPCDDNGAPCSWVESDLCSACLAEVKTDPMAAADFFDWIGEHGPDLERSIEQLEREDPRVAAAALELEQVTAELERTLPLGMRLEQVILPSRVDVDDEGAVDDGAPDNAPDSDR